MSSYERELRRKAHQLNAEIACGLAALVHFCGWRAGLIGADGVSFGVAMVPFVFVLSTRFLSRPPQK